MTSLGEGYLGGLAFGEVAGTIPPPSLLIALFKNQEIIDMSFLKNIAGQSIAFPVLLLATGAQYTGTAATLSPFVVLDNGTKTAGGGTVTKKSDGVYTYAPTQAETNGDHVFYSLEAATIINNAGINIYPQDTSNASLASSLTTIDTNVDAILVDTATSIPAQISGLNNITAADVLAAGDIDGFSLENSSKLILAASAGTLSGAATTTVLIRAVDNSKTRITAAVDVDGNRTAVTTDVTG